MRINENVALATDKVLLVPYCKRHVAVYHDWMLDEELRAATASESLTLDEEYAMQRSWRQDKDKLTFIICTPRPDAQIIHGRDVDSKEAMVGDINLFLFELDGEETEHYEQSESTGSAKVVGEIELMIACKDLWRHGYGRAALLLFLHYVNRHLSTIMDEAYGLESTKQLVYLRAKIDQTNAASIALFENMGFKKISPEPNYFGEIELRCADWQIFQQREGLHCRELVYLDDNS